MGANGERGMKRITKGSWVENTATGERSLLVTLPSETGGRYFEIEVVSRPFGGKNSIPAHYHPTYTERFEILSGQARYMLGGKEQSAGAGETLLFPPRIVHIHPWSDSIEELRVRLRSEANPPDMHGLNANINAAITQYGLASAGKVNKDGQAAFLQLAVSANSILPGACPAGFSIPAARVLFGAFAVAGRLAGYRESYAEYGEI